MIILRVVAVEKIRMEVGTKIGTIKIKHGIGTIKSKGGIMKVGQNIGHQDTG
jgi:hypothetical protein